jgi:ABC-type cobalamin/Fe3+-siderophores transport system ATPase subunit
MTSILAVDALSVSIAANTLLSDISFSINSGDYVCVLGPNGAGKSTLLKAIMGITAAHHGTITLNQQPVTRINQKQLARQISYVPQANNHPLFFTVSDFIKMGRYAYHTAFSDWNSDDQQAFDRAVEITQCDAFLARQMNTLSGGEAQRVMIASALCQLTPILLLDEPTSFLDPHHQVEVHHLISDLNIHHNMTIIEVSHDLNHAAQHSQHILALKNGKHLWHGPSNQFLTEARLFELYDQHFVFSAHPQTGHSIALPSESR